MRDELMRNTAVEYFKTSHFERNGKAFFFDQMHGTPNFGTVVFSLLMNLHTTRFI